MRMRMGMSVCRRTIRVVRTVVGDERSGSFACCSGRSRRNRLLLLGRLRLLVRGKGIRVMRRRVRMRMRMRRMMQVLILGGLLLLLLCCRDVRHWLLAFSPRRWMRKRMGMRQGLLDLWLGLLLLLLLEMRVSTRSRLRSTRWRR